MVKVLSFDPGKNSGSSKSGTGWCLQDEDKVYDFGTTRNLIELLGTHSFGKFDVVVYEGYRIREATLSQNVGISLSAVQNIGAIQLFAFVHNAITYEYLPQQKPTQWKATGMNPTKVPKSQSHWIDAFNHGRYYLIQHCGAPTALEQEMRRNGEI